MTAARVEQIKQNLQAALSPIKLEISDDSHLHIGHAGAGKGGHFSVYVVSEAFQNLSLIKRHRLIYQALDSMMPDEIHALSIESLSPEEI